MIFQIYILDKKFEDLIDFLLLIDDDKSYYVYINDFNRFMFYKTKIKIKCLQCFSRENVSIKHEGDCLSINWVQSVEVEEGTIEFKNYLKQIPVPFKIYTDFECNLENTEVYKGFYSR